MADRTFSANVCCWRERKRTNSDGSQNVGRHGFLDRCFDCPAALARILDIAGEVLELAVLGERRGREIEQPRGHDAAAAPDFGDVGQVEVKALVGRQLLRGTVLHDVEALGEGLHHAVLDAVMDHLHEVAGARGAGVDVAALGARIERLAPAGAFDLANPRRQCREDRIEPLHRLGVAADHQAVAALQAPHAARRADIEIMEALWA
jgi:hypothetical protein